MQAGRATAKLSVSTSYREISKLIGTKPVAGVVLEALSDGGWVDMGCRDKSTEPAGRERCGRRPQRQHALWLRGCLS
jgi:hypothetical protein